MTSSHPPSVVYLADHSLLLAIPAFVPALLIAGIVVYIAMRDRKAEERENSEQSTDTDSQENE